MTIKSEDSDVKPVLRRSKKTSSKPCNADLPEAFLKNGAWGLLIKSLIRYIATTSEVFNASDETLLHAMNELLIHFYSETGVNYTLTITCPAFRLVSIFSMQDMKLY